MLAHAAAPTAYSYSAILGDSGVAGLTPLCFDDQRVAEEPIEPFSHSWSLRNRWPRRPGKLERVNPDLDRRDASHEQAKHEQLQTTGAPALGYARELRERCSRSRIPVHRMAFRHRKGSGLEHIPPIPPLHTNPLARILHSFTSPTGSRYRKCEDTCRLPATRGGRLSYRMAAPLLWVASPRPLGYSADIGASRQGMACPPVL